jgi:eukaryotic-like serine/threonine-protein kinase
MTNAKEMAYETVLHSYRPEGTPRQGGSGIVFKARNEDGEVFAIKIIDRGKATRDRNRRFKNELEYCRRENHRNIVKVLDDGFTIEKGVKIPFYVMPFYPGTLRDLMKGGIPDGKALSLFLQILEGVEAAHLRGVWHRDLKPENILYDPATDTLVVADFGIAHFEQEDLYTAVETKDGQRLANFQYAAPEQRMRDKAIDHRTDIYALGLVLNEMFTGEILQGAGYKRIGSAALRLQYLDEIVETMVQQDPRQRVGSIKDVKKLLREKGDQFVADQKLSELRNVVIPATQIDDPLIIDPPELEDVDYRDGRIIFTLSRPVNQYWAQAFTGQFVREYISNLSPANFSVSGLTVGVRADERFAGHAQEHFKRYLSGANSGYKRMIEEAQKKKEEQARLARQKQIDEEMKRQQILKILKGN